MRSPLVIVACLMPSAVGRAQTVPMAPERWTSVRSNTKGADTTADSAQFVMHLGRPSLFVPDGFTFAKGLDMRNGTLEADVAAYPQGAFFGLGFHVASPDQYEIVFFRPHSSTATVQYATSFFNMNAWQFFPPPYYATSPTFPVDRWVHVRIVVKGVTAALYLDSAKTPDVEVDDLTLGSAGGSIGFWGRGGGGYLSNVQVEPDPTPYPTTRTAFAPGTITEGWSISDAFNVPATNPDVYPDVHALKWQPVEAEREGLVMIGRYRRDPRVDPPRPLRDRPTPAAPGTQVVFARTVLESDRDRTAKMWVGCSDDVVVYLNGRPLYAGRNSMAFRDPDALGWFYPYADAVFLPLKKGKNELLLAVSETFAGWGFMCRFDQPSVPGVHAGSRQAAARTAPGSRG